MSWVEKQPAETFLRHGPRQKKGAGPMMNLLSFQRQRQICIKDHQAVSTQDFKIDFYRNEHLERISWKPENMEGLMAEFHISMVPQCSMALSAGSWNHCCLCA
jgi:hypothetical protein